jgi:hypothetical protein
MDRQEHVQTLEGEGRLLQNGDVMLAPAVYRIDISRRIHVVRSMTGESEVEGLARIEGMLFSPVPWSLVGEPVELELADGRKWECFIRSSNGDLVNRGGIR